MVGRPFSCFPPGRPSMRWVGPKFAALQLAPVRVVDCCRGLAACPPSWVELIFCRHAVACLSSIGPTLFSAYFSAFPDGDSKVCVCVCVCVCSLFGSRGLPLGQIVGPSRASGDIAGVRSAAGGAYSATALGCGRQSRQPRGGLPTGVTVGRTRSQPGVECHAYRRA